MDFAIRNPQRALEFVRFSSNAGGLLGNDLDGHSSSAMAGAISGAHVGLKRLPRELAKRVNDQGQWGFEELIELSSRCYRQNRRA